MCIDYTNLNKACKKDPFGLPQINQVVDSTTGCSLPSFLNYYLGYHQIPLQVEYQIKTSFITPFSAFFIQLFPSDSKARVQLISGVYNSVCTLNLGAMQKRMLMTW
jgi:hypothetical protein